MKSTIKKIGILSLLILSITSVNAQKLKKFGSSIEKKIGFKSIRVPYTDVVSYLDYAAQGNEDEVKDGKKFYYIYVWVPAVAPELGVRMVSPAVEAKNAIETQEYLDNKDSKDYFDTYITLERSNIVNAKDLNPDAVANAKWITLDRNDDSSELHKNPGGNKYNSLLRYKSESGDPLKALTVGLYRIGFTTYKTGEVSGTFLAQIAAPVKLPGVQIAKTVKKLAEQMKETK